MLVATLLSLTFSSVINYSRTFNKSYNTPFVDAHTCDIVHDMENYNFIRNATRATYAGYFRDGRHRVRHPNILLLFKRLIKLYRMHIEIGMTHLYNYTLNGADDDSFAYFKKAA